MKLDPFIKWFTIFLLAVMIATGFASCNSVKQVLKSPDKTNQVGIEWEKTHGCINDTVTNILPGRDSIIHDTSESVTVTVRHDTLTNTDTKELLKYITKTIQRTDTIKSLIEDKRRVEIYSDSLIYYHGYKDELKNEVSVERKKSNKWKLMFWSLASLIFVIQCIKFYLKYIK